MSVETWRCYQCGSACSVRDLCPCWDDISDAVKDDLLGEDR